MDFGILQEEIFVAGFDQLGFLLLRSQIGHVINFGVLQAKKVFAGGLCDWHLRDVFHTKLDAEIVQSFLVYQAVCPKSLLVEEDGFFQVSRVEQFLVVVFVEALYFDS